MKCIDCKNCIGTVDDYYICYLGEQIELIEDCIALDDNQGCDGFVYDSNDDFEA